MKPFVGITTVLVLALAAVLNLGHFREPSSQPLMAAYDISPPPSHLFFVFDRVTNTRLLVDTGAEISVPAMAADHQRSQNTSSLQAQKNAAISTYGFRSLTVDFRLRRRFRWVFVVADVHFAKLSADF